jgi:hypothetical protein
MRREIAPGLYGLLVAPERQRQEFSGLAEALKTFDGYEAVHRHEVGAQSRRKAEIIPFPVLPIRPDFEDHRDHGLINSA